MSWVTAIARAELRQLQGYQHAPWEPGLTRLHANESPWRDASDHSVAGLNRYPEPHPYEFERQLAAHLRVPPECLLATRGSDEAIELLVRAYCAAGHSSILHTPPTFGMYAVSARVQGAEVIAVPLRREHEFALDLDAVRAAVRPDLRLVFLCSPNNPTGNLLARRDLLQLAAELAGRALLVVDEAYVDFAGQPTLAEDMPALAGLVVLRTLSKAYALAGARCGMLLAHAEIVALLRGIIQPYAVTQLTIEAVTQALADSGAAARARIARLRTERAHLAAGLAALPAVRRVWPSDANFLLCEFHDAPLALRRAHDAGMLLRDFSAAPGLGGSLRITVGSAEQNQRLLESLA